MPSGGCYVEDEEFNCVLNRKAVIAIQNQDDNCFWFVLLASSHTGDRTHRVNHYDKPDVIATARELCLKSDCECGRRVNFIGLPNVEEKVNTNIYMLDIRDLPIIKPDVNLYNHACFKYENRNNGAHWLLYDSVHCHCHVITEND